MITINGELNRKIRIGLIGGGQGSFIGRVHATAACLDGRAEVVAGALSSDPEKAIASAPSYGIAEKRAYRSYSEMLEKEAQLPEDQRIDLVSIVTPNHVHFPAAKAAIQEGFNVVCDKPMTLTVPEAEELEHLVEKHRVVFGLTHNYTGYPLVRQAREMILNGEFGEIQAIRVQYIQGWLSTLLESSGQKQALWRTDPSKSGVAGAFGDIGSHAENLACYMTGLNVDNVYARLKTFVPGRKLDDYGSAICQMTGALSYQNDTILTLTASQISQGRENDLAIEIDGTEGSLSWGQENPNFMVVRKNGAPHQTFTRDPNASWASPGHKEACRLPSGHPEGFLEGFANVYRAAFDQMVKRALGLDYLLDGTIYPNVHDGLKGMKFIEACVQSSNERRCVEL